MESISSPLVTSTVSVYSDSNIINVKPEPASMTSVGKENVLKDSSNTKSMSKMSSSSLSAALKSVKRLRPGDSELLRAKRKAAAAAKLGVPVQTRNPATMAKRNARERRRVQNINHTLDSLEKILPEYYMDKKDKNSKKLSKLEVLRSTIDYIQTLQFVLNEDSKNNNMLFDPQFLQQFLPMHMQQPMDIQPQYIAHAQSMNNMDLNVMAPPQAPAPVAYAAPSQGHVGDNWGMMPSLSLMTQSSPMLSSTNGLYPGQYEHMHQTPVPAPSPHLQQTQQQHTAWNIADIL